MHLKNAEEAIAYKIKPYKGYIFLDKLKGKIGSDYVLKDCDGNKVTRINIKENQSTEILLSQKEKHYTFTITKADLAKSS